jgi:hypothetical protein
MGDGWFGTVRELATFLSAMGASRHDDGSFVLVGDPVVIGAYDDSVVVPPGAEYVLDHGVFGSERHVPIAEALRSTSYGYAVKVYG